MNSLKKSVQIAPRFSSIVRMMGGKNDGKAGAIREAGGAFAKMEVAHEEEYFYKQRQEQLALLAKKQVDDTQFRENAIKHHEEAIKKHQDAIAAARKK